MRVGGMLTGYDAEANAASSPNVTTPIKFLCAYPYLTKISA